MLECCQHDLFRVRTGLAVKMVSDGASWRFRKKGKVVEPVAFKLEPMVVSQVGKVQFGEDVLHGEESVGILLYDVGLRLTNKLPYVPGMESIAAAIYQPHLKILSTSDSPYFIFLNSKAFHSFWAFVFSWQ